VENLSQVFHRFSSIIHGNQDHTSSIGSPRIVVTHGFRKIGCHASISIEVPDESHDYHRVLDLFIGQDEENKYAKGKTLLEKFRKVEADKDALALLAIEASVVALEHRYFPYGAVLKNWDGTLVVARNNTAQHKEIDKHAESLAADQAGGNNEIMISTAEPCPACVQKLEGSDIAGIRYILKQPVEWSGELALQHLLKKRDLGLMGFRAFEKEKIPLALEVLYRANAPDGVFPGQFDRTIVLNELRRREG
jgi:tRNA(Arg) A34 adenosine deaminase TadA